MYVLFMTFKKYLNLRLGQFRLGKVSMIFEIMNGRLITLGKFYNQEIIYINNHKSD